jgi:hypothetical protein
MNWLGALSPSHNLFILITIVFSRSALVNSNASVFQKNHPTVKRRIVVEEEGIPCRSTIPFSQENAKPWPRPKPVPSQDFICNGSREAFKFRKFTNHIFEQRNVIECCEPNCKHRWLSETRSLLRRVRHPWNPVDGVIVIKLAEDRVLQLEALGLSSLKLDRVVRGKKLPIPQVG